MSLEVSTKYKQAQLIGCGILDKEISWLIKKNNWQIDTVFLRSSLHTDFDLLKNDLCSQLAKSSYPDKIVFYGDCHPQMDSIIENFKAVRTKGQNCAEILLGKELFTKELADGAYFLMENWALGWEKVFEKTFGNDREIVKQIFHIDRKYILAIKTFCSIDYSSVAEKFAQYVDLPLSWITVGPGNLELTLQNTLTQINGNNYE
jgi:hypothetical protein